MGSLDWATNMKVTVQYLLKDFLEVDEVNTVGELKLKLSQSPNFDDHENWNEWKLFLGGLELDDPAVLLADLDTDHRIVLSAPPEPERLGLKSRIYKSNKTRFMVVETENKPEIIPLRPETEQTAQLPEKFHFFGSQKFGLITNIVEDLKKPGERQVQCDIFEVNDEGYLYVWADPDDLMRIPLDAPAKVFLVKDKDHWPHRGKEVKPRKKPKLYDEISLKGPNGRDHIHWIMNELKQN